MCVQYYTRGCQTYRKIPAGGKNVDVREVQIFVGELAANAGDRAVRKFEAYSLNA
jgi:hypothetical protein